MLRDITIGQYYQTESVLHKMDPRVKLGGTLLYIISLFLFKNFAGYIIAALFLGIVIKLSKVPFKFMVKGMKTIMLLLMITVVFNLFLTQGEVLVTVWKLTITVEGLRTAVSMAIRLTLLIISSSVMTLTTTPNQLTDALESLLGPLKKIHVPVHEISMMMSIALRFIPILLEAKYEGEHYTGLEIQDEMADMAARSVALNHLEEKVSIVKGDIKEASRLFGAASFDVVTSNPPYMNDAHGLKNPDLPKAISRHEVLCTLDDVTREAARLLRPGGRFYMVHRPHRLIEIITALTKYKLEPKRMKMVHPFVEKDANMVLIEAVRGGKSMIKVEAPIVVYQEPGVYTQEIYDIYGY